jgi:hypothetical protein
MTFRMLLFILLIFSFLIPVDIRPPFAYVSSDFLRSAQDNDEWHAMQTSLPGNPTVRYVATGFGP